MEKLLENCKLEEVPENMVKLLNELVNLVEINNAIANAKLGKAPGPDGFSATYYKTFKEELVPVLKILINEILKMGENPKFWKVANIMLKGKRI